MDLQIKIHLWFICNITQPHILLAVWELFNISRTMHKMTCTNSMACSFPWFKTLMFLALKRYLNFTADSTEVNNIKDLQQQIQNRYEVILMTWNFPVSYVISVQMCNILCWSIFFYLQEAITWIPHFIRPMFTYSWMRLYHERDWIFCVTINECYYNQEA